MNLDNITRLVASIDIMTFSNIVSPINSNKHNFIDIPYPSNKDGCPGCNTAKTLWEAELENGHQVMVCKDCDATWKSKGNGGWIQIN
jgi:hypothetical protein